MSLANKLLSTLFILCFLLEKSIIPNDWHEAKTLFQTWVGDYYTVLETQALQEINKLCQERSIAEATNSNQTEDSDIDRSSEIVSDNENILESNVNDLLIEACESLIPITCQGYEIAVTETPEEFTLNDVVRNLLIIYFILKDVEKIDINYDVNDPDYDPYYGLMNFFREKNILINNWEDLKSQCRQWIGQENFNTEYQKAEETLITMRSALQKQFSSMDPDEIKNPETEKPEEKSVSSPSAFPQSLFSSRSSPTDNQHTLQTNEKSKMIGNK